MMRVPAMLVAAKDGDGLARADSMAPADWTRALRLGVLLVVATLAAVLFGAAVVFCFATGVVGNPF